MSLNQSWYSLSSSSRCQCQDALGDLSSRLLMTKSVQISPLTRTGWAGMSGMGLGGQGMSGIGHQSNKWQIKEDRFVCLVYPNVFVYRDNISISRILRVKCWWLKTCMNLYEQMEGQMKKFSLKWPRGQSISRNLRLCLCLCHWPGPWTTWTRDFWLLLAVGFGDRWHLTPDTWTLTI